MTMNSLLGWFITIVRNTFVLNRILPTSQGRKFSKEQVSSNRIQKFHSPLQKEISCIFCKCKIRKKGGLILLPASINTKQGTSKTRKWGQCVVVHGGLLASFLSSSAIPGWWEVRANHTNKLKKGGFLIVRKKVCVGFVSVGGMKAATSFSEKRVKIWGGTMVPNLNEGRCRWYSLILLKKMNCGTLSDFH